MFPGPTPTGRGVPVGGAGRRREGLGKGADTSPAATLPARLRLPGPEQLLPVAPRPSAQDGSSQGGVLLCFIPEEPPGAGPLPWGTRDGAGRLSVSWGCMSAVNCW